MCSNHTNHCLGNLGVSSTLADAVFTRLVPSAGETSYGSTQCDRNLTMYRSTETNSVFMQVFLFLMCVCVCVYIFLVDWFLMAHLCPRRSLLSHFAVCRTVRHPFVASQVLTPRMSFIMDGVGVSRLCPGDNSLSCPFFCGKKRKRKEVCLHLLSWNNSVFPLNKLSCRDF